MIGPASPLGRERGNVSLIEQVDVDTFPLCAAQRRGGFRRLAVLRWPNEEGTHPGLRPPLRRGNPPRPAATPPRRGVENHPLSGGVPRSGGVGFVVSPCCAGRTGWTAREPTPACGHPSKEGSRGWPSRYPPGPLLRHPCGYSPSYRRLGHLEPASDSRRQGFRPSKAAGVPTPALRATPPWRGAGGSWLCVLLVRVGRLGALWRAQHLIPYTRPRR